MVRGSVRVESSKGRREMVVSSWYLAGLDLKRQIVCIKLNYLFMGFLQCVEPCVFRTIITL